MIVGFVGKMLVIRMAENGTWQIRTRVKQPRWQAMNGTLAEHLEKGMRYV
jgi:hypothetical protein